MVPPKFTHSSHHAPLPVRMHTAAVVTSARLVVAYSLGVGTQLKGHFPISSSASFPPSEALLKIPLLVLSLSSLL